MLIDTLIKRDQIEMIRQGGRGGDHHLLFTRGDDVRVSTIFYYTGYDSNVTETMVLGTMLINAYHYETLTEDEWHKKYEYTPESVVAVYNRSAVMRKTEELKKLLGPLYNDYIQALKDDHILNPDHLCDGCMKKPGEEKELFLRSVGEFTYYACSDCNDKIVDDIMALIYGKKPTNEYSARPCLYHWHHGGYCGCKEGIGQHDSINPSAI